VAIVIPLRGFSAVDRPGQHFYNPEADAAFAKTIRENIKNGVEVVEVDAHINDSRFARAVVDTFDKLVKRGGIPHGKKV
ncbi:MAG TPA: Tm-1-like ATP-binding domain-containing protein, partial [Dehalococcoidia bacterium]|nr:Tm-1-like ATP-binding domain-containing protein [Dehalococcoidia bacterium]